MSPLNLLIAVSLLGFVLWSGRRVPLAGRRKWVVIGCRVAAVGALCAALWGPPHRRTHDVPRRIVYLVDRSKSIDEAQRAWMARRLASLDSLRPPQIERAVIAFGQEARVILPFGSKPLADPEAIRDLLDGSDVNGDETSLEAALLAALSATPRVANLAGGERMSLTGVVLLSDGRETAGEVTGLLAAVRRLGLAVFPAPPPVFGESKTVWEGLAVPPVVQRGSSIPAQLVIFNAGPRTKQGQVTVALHGVSIKRQRVTVRPGWQVIRVMVPAIQRGTMALDVRLEIPGEGLVDERRAYTEIEGPPQLLLVSDRVTTLPALAAALKRREIDIAVARPEDLAQDVKGLLDYDAVALFNLPKSSLSARHAEALRTYLEAFGGGLVMIGLGGDLAREITTPSPLDPLLPVIFEPKGLQEAKRRVCMILLIDRSASMLGPRIAATKRAAVELVKQLSPEDLVGVLAFDTRPYVITEVQPAGQARSGLVEKLVKLRSTGGTDVYPALTAAGDRLELTGATLKHILLLSDRNTPVKPQAYDALFKSFRLTGTTVSTIGIGSAFINTDYLRYVASSTGGAFYQMRALDELPQLIARDTQRELGRLPFAEGSFRPSKSPTSDWFEGTTDWPALRGYLTTTARPGARVDVTVNGGDGDDPLLARWTMGRGRVVSFTSDADARWSPEWIRWPGFDAAWAQVVRWAMRPRLAEELFVWVDGRHETPRLVVEGELSNPRGALISADHAQTLPLSFVQTGTWRWETPLEHLPGGWYQLALEDARPSGPPVFAKRWVQVGSPPASQEIAGQPPHETLLRQIARSTSGVYDAPDHAFLPPATPATTTEPLLTWLLPFVLIALLVDIALRGSSML